MSERPLLASTTSGGLVPRQRQLAASSCRSSNELGDPLDRDVGVLRLELLVELLIWAACPPRTSWSHTVSVTLPALADVGAHRGAGRGGRGGGGAARAGRARGRGGEADRAGTISSRGLRGFIACSREEEGDNGGQYGVAAGGPGSRDHLDVGVAGDGGRGAAHRRRPAGWARSPRGRRSGASARSGRSRRRPWSRTVCHQSAMSPQPGAASEPPNCCTASAEHSVANATRSASGQPDRVPTTMLAPNTSPAPVGSSAGTAQRRHPHLLAGGASRSPARPARRW